MRCLEIHEETMRGCEGALDGVVDNVSSSFSATEAVSCLLCCLLCSFRQLRVGLEVRRFLHRP